MSAALLDFANDWIRRGGLAVLALIVFAESGLAFGFFFPGDSLLFFAGFLASPAGGHRLPGGLAAVAAVAFAAAVLGDQVGYVFGSWVGPALFGRPRNRLFNPDSVVRAQLFFDRHGPKTIVLARFVPVVRTFTPIVAGVGRMKYRVFVTYNLVGALLWAVGITTLGYLLGRVDFVKHNIEYAAIVIVAISVVPMIVEYLRHRRDSDADEPAQVTRSN